MHGQDDYYNEMLRILRKTAEAHGHLPHDSHKLPFWKQLCITCGAMLLLVLIVTLKLASHH